MRELLLIVIVAALCLVALVKPRIGMLGYTWFALMRPDVLSWSAGKPYSLALAVCTLTGSLLHFQEFGTIFRNRISCLLVLLLVPVTISASSAVSPDLSWPAWNYFIRIILMALLIVVYTRTETELRTLLIIIGASVGILGLKLGLFGFIVGDAQYMDAYTDTMMSDNNMLALALAMAIPLCWYMAGLVTSKLVRMSLFAMAFGLMAGVVMTHSRGGALSAGVALLLIALRSKRKFLTLAVLVMCAAPAVYVVRDTYLARLSTITTNEAEADGSIRSRINHRRAAFAMWKDYPFFGVGFGMENYVLLAPQYLGYDDFHVAHNTYFQILADSGAFAFLIYICLFFGTIVWLERSARAAARDTPGKEVYPLAIQTSLIAFAVGSYFLSRDTYDLLYIVLMAAAAWHTVQTNEAFDLASEDDRHINDSALAVVT